MDFLDREIEEEAQGGFVFTEITQRLLDEAKKHVPQLPAGLTVTQQRLVDALDAGGILVLWECLVLIVREHMVTEAEMARSDSGTGRARFDQTRTQDDCVPGRGSDSDSATEDDHVTLSRLDDLVLVPDSQPPIQTSPGPSYQPQKRSPRGDRSEGFTKYGHTCWNRFLTDVEKGTDTRLLYYLSALPSELLRSLIIGDLPSRMQDQDFSSRMKHFTTPTPSQGTYTMFIARLVCHSRMAISARRRHHCVAWVLTPGQTLDVIALVRLYADLDDPESEEMAKKIDAQFYQDVHKIDYATQRYYGGGGSRDQFHKHLLWAQSWVIALLANDNEKGEEPGPRGDADREKFSEDDQYMAGFGRSADFYRSHSNQNQNIEGSSAKYLKLREQISRYPANLKKCVELIKSGHDSESPKQTSVQGHKTLDDEDLHHADEMLSAMEDYEAKYPTDSA